MSGKSERVQELRAFLERAGWSDPSITPLAGDASTRRYFRVSRNGHRAILMDQPQNAETPACPPDAAAEERRALGYNAVARLAGPDCARFIAAAGYLRARGLSVPQVYDAEIPQGFVLMEDLGDELYADALSRGADESEIYGSAVDALAQLHSAGAPPDLAPGKPLHAYDEIAQLAEIDLMTDWFMPLALRRAASEEEVSEHRQLWRDALRPVRAVAPVFVHRDYHSPNLLWLAGRPGIQRVGIIDFQDAVAGTRSYDLISLIEDARRDVSRELGEAMTRRYLAAMARRGHALDGDTHRAEMAVIAAQRNAKIVGIFSRLYSRDGKERYLRHLPRIWRYLSHDLEHPTLAALRAWYDRTIPGEARGIRIADGALT